MRAYYYAVINPLVCRYVHMYVCILKYLAFVFIFLGLYIPAKGLYRYSLTYFIDKIYISSSFSAHVAHFNDFVVDVVTQICC